MKDKNNIDMDFHGKRRKIEEASRNILLNTLLGKVKGSDLFQRGGQNMKQAAGRGTSRYFWSQMGHF